MMPIKYFKNLIIALASIFILSSCSKYLDQDINPYTTEDLVLMNDANISGLWATFINSGLENGFRQVGGSALLANASDEADLNQPFSSVQYFNLGTWNQYYNPEDVWTKYYSTIRDANNFLEKVDSSKNVYFTYKHYQGIDNNVLYYNKLFNYKAYRIDAKFMKAYAHFELWKRYGKIAITDKVMTPEEAAALNQSTTPEVVHYVAGLLNQIIPEFNILENMPGSSYHNGQWSSSFTGRITQGAALALKCRLYLYAASPLHTASGQYDKALCDSAAKAASQIIKSGIYSTNISYRDMQFETALANNPEDILDSRVVVGQGFLFGRFNYMETWNYPHGGNILLYNDENVCGNATCPSQNLVDAYTTTSGNPVDYSKANPYDQIKDLRFNQSILHDGETFNGITIDAKEGGIAGIGKVNSTTTGYYLKKFVQENVNIKSGETAKHLWYIFRYGEVLLNYAEAKFYGSGKDFGAGVSSVEAINLLHKRLDIAGGTRVNPTDLTILTEDIIRNERRIELAFEGSRFWDVRRWKIAGITENQALNKMRIDASGFHKEKLEDRVFDALKMYFYPIPASDIKNYNNWNNNGW